MVKYDKDETAYYESLDDAKKSKIDKGVYLLGKNTKYTPDRTSTKLRVFTRIDFLSCFMLGIYLSPSSC